MTNPVFNPEDPRLTSFVLGEIDDSDRAEIEQLLETSEEAQAAVKEIEETIGVLKEGLASEPTPELTAEQRAVVEEQLAGSTMAVSAGASPQRPGARFGKVAGAVASVAALGLVVTLAAPQLQPARDALMSPLSQLASNSDSSAEAVAMTEWENATGFSEEYDGPDCDGIVLPAKVGEVLSNNDITKLNLASEKSQLSIEQAEHEQQVARLMAVADKERRFNLANSASQPFAEGRSEKDFAKRDTAQTAQRLIADAGSRPQPGSNRPGDISRVGRRLVELPAESKPAAAPMIGRSSAAENGGKRSTFYTDLSSNSPQSGDSSLKADAPLTTAPASDKSGTAKVKFANQVAGTASGKAGEGPRGAGQQFGNGQPASPHTRETVVRNGVVVAPGDLANPYLIDKSKGRLDGQPVGGAVVDSSEPASAAALLPGRAQAQNQPKKGVLFLEEAPQVGQKRPVPPPAPSSEAAVLRQIRQREEALARGGEVEKLVELSKESQTQLQTRLAAIDSGATRRVSGRGFGLEGRDLQEQLQQYSDGLILARTNREQNSEARLQSFGFGNETYEAIVENDFIVPVIGDKEKSLSTISVDVDTASYANMRRFLNRDQLPPANSVRIEELVNYFKYDYPEPEGDEPFSVKIELAMCPWQPSHRLAMVGLKAKTIEKAKRPPTNLVFLLDVSGSMRASNKLPLVQQSMRLLVEEMTEDDRVSIVTYASNAGVRLQSTLGSKKQEILNAINGLRAGGSTNGEGGIRMAYDEANRHYFQGGANRVILCSDGDFNVGKSSDGDLVELIQEKAASGVFLSVFGFGMGNLKDAKLEKLADKGNGHYGYIDNLNEAKKVFQDELVGTLYTVAKDVKLQVEFNPATVGAYRLIGYENRKLAAQDFTDDTKDAGEIGSGHTVTALYEIIPKQVLLSEPEVDGLKYQASAKKAATDDAGTNPGDKPADVAEPQPVDEELLTVKLRFKKPDEEVSQPVQQDFPVKDVTIAGKQLSATSDDLMFAASVASFGMNLRGSKYRGNWGFAEALESAQGAQGDGNDAQRTEFIQLVQRAMRITGQQVGPQPRTTQGTTTRPGELGATEARIKASVDGKYRRLVKKIEVRDDFQKFGAFNDYGPWEGSEYAGHKDLPPGNWVYVYPNWYIWAEAIVPPVEDKPAVEAVTSSDGSVKSAVDTPADEKPAVK